MNSVGQAIDSKESYILVEIQQMRLTTLSDYEFDAEVETIFVWKKQQMIKSGPRKNFRRKILNIFTITLSSLFMSKTVLAVDTPMVEPKGLIEYGKSYFSVDAWKRYLATGVTTKVHQNVMTIVIPGTCLLATTAAMFYGLHLNSALISERQSSFRVFTVLKKQLKEAIHVAEQFKNVSEEIRSNMVEYKNLYNVCEKEIVHFINASESCSQELLPLKHAFDFCEANLKAETQLNTRLLEGQFTTGKFSKIVAISIIKYMMENN
jgi:hypothetical protein